MIIYNINSIALNYEEYLFLNNSKQCSNYFEYVEEKYGIPKNLMRSISVVETGRWHKDTKMYFTWPWTVNQEGNSNYYSTKKEAIKKVKDLLERGYTNIDIGCMQINLHHHPEAFLNLEQAFDPKTNIEYAAKFLATNYQKLKSWPKAVAFYHSQNSIGKEYSDKVFKMHNNYRTKKFDYDFCTSATGEIISCTNIFYYTKENLPSIFASDNSNNKGNTKSDVNKQKKYNLRKSPKRLKSNMIPYSINN